MKEHLIAFLIYSYIGANLEHISYFIESFSNNYKPKILANPVITGFPLYGFGAYLLIIVNKILPIKNMLIKFIINGFILSTIEYLVGLLVNAGKIMILKELIHGIIVKKSIIYMG